MTKNKICLFNSKVMDLIAHYHVTKNKICLFNSKVMDLIAHYHVTKKQDLFIQQ